MSGYFCSKYSWLLLNRPPSVRRGPGARAAAKPSRTCHLLFAAAKRHPDAGNRTEGEAQAVLTGEDA